MPPNFYFYINQAHRQSHVRLPQPKDPSYPLVKDTAPRSTQLQAGPWGSCPHAPWDVAVPCSLLLCRGAAPRLGPSCACRADKGSTGEAEVVSQLGATERLFEPHQAPGKAQGGQWVLRVLLPLRLSLGAAGSPLGAGVSPHPGVQGQRRSGPQAVLKFHPQLGKGTSGKCKSTICGDWRGVALHSGSLLPCQHRAKARDPEEQGDGAVQAL